MKTYKEIYQHLIYEWNEELLEEENKKLFNSNNIKHLINERSYYDNFSQDFEDYFVEKFKEIWQNIKKDPTNNLIEIPFKTVIEKLSQQDFNDYKDFGMFLDILKNNKGILQLSICTDGCYYECPINFYKKEIRIYSETPKVSNLNLKIFNEENLKQVRDFYQQYIQKITDNEKTLNLALLKIKENLINTYQWGRINISFNYFNNQRYIDDLDVAVSHEFQHLMDYLININYANWRFARMYSNTPHNSFDRNLAVLEKDKQNFQQINYFLDSGQFKELSSTYVQYLRKCFVKNTEIITNDNINNFIIAFYKICNLNFVSKIKRTEIIKKYQIDICKIRDIQDMIKFFQVIYDDSLVQKHEFNTINKWEYLNSLLRKELENQLI